MRGGTLELLANFPVSPCRQGSCKSSSRPARRTKRKAPPNLLMTGRSGGDLEVNALHSWGKLHLCQGAGTHSRGAFSFSPHERSRCFRFNIRAASDFVF